jgi:hypothetical protein
MKTTGIKRYIVELILTCFKDFKILAIDFSAKALSCQVLADLEVVFSLRVLQGGFTEKKPGQGHFHQTAPRRFASSSGTDYKVLVRV